MGTHISIIMVTAMNTAMNSFAFLQMVQICDSLFPIGTFTLSNGLETFVCKDKIKSDQDLVHYLESVLEILPFNDLGTMMLAYRQEGEYGYLEQLDALSMAYKAPMEVRMGNKKLCSRFMKTMKKIAEYPKLMEYQKKIENGCCIGNHAIAVGLFAKDIGLACEVAAGIYAYSLLSAIVTNAVKTVPLSQMSGQKILNECLKKIDVCIGIAQNIDMEDLGIGATEIDIEAMNHEVLYSRLYMS